MAPKVLLSILILSGIGFLISSTAPPDANDAQLTIHAKSPKKTGQLRLKLRTKGSNQRHNDNGGHMVLVDITVDMTAAEKAAAIADQIQTFVPNINATSTGGSVNVQPDPGNVDDQRIYIADVDDKSEEGLKKLDTPNWSVSNGPDVIAPPIEFFGPTNSTNLISYTDWAIYTFSGTPTGTSSDGTPGYVGISVNDFEVVGPTAGITMSQGLDIIVTEAEAYPEVQAFVDYATQRVLILSLDTIFTQGLVSHDSGIDIAWSLMQ